MVDNIRAEQGTKIHPFKIFIGGIFLIGAAIFMADGESKIAKRYHTLNEGITEVKPVDATSIDAENNGKLVYISALAESTGSDGLNDHQFGVHAEGLRLVRTVEMYQWEQYTAGSKNNKRKDYRKTWSEQRIDSDRFQAKTHTNPKQVYPSQSFHNGTIQMGAYILNPELLDQLETTPIPASVPENLEGTLDGNYLFVGNDPTSPEIGDHRISFGVIETGPLSVIATQEADHLTPWHTPRGNIIGIAGKGEVTSDQLFDNQKQETQKQSWFHRLFGLLVMILGLGFTLKKEKDIQPDEFLRALAGSLIVGGTAIALTWAKVYLLG